MRRKVFVGILEEGLKSNFDLFGGKEVGGMKLDLVAAYRERVSRYMISRRQEIYAYQSHNHILYRHFDSVLSKGDIDEWRAWLEGNLSEIIQVDKEHMSSVITVIWSSDRAIDEDVRKAIKRFRYYKGFMFGLKGWVNVKLVHVDLSTRRIVTNRLGKDVVKLVEESPEWRDRVA